MVYYTAMIQYDCKSVCYFKLEVLVKSDTVSDLMSTKVLLASSIPFSVSSYVKWEMHITVC